MRYQEPIEQSAEYLRMALPYMSRQDAGLHPISYAVWYDYVACRNAELQREIDKITADGKKLSDDQTLALYNKHIIGSREQLMNQVSITLKQLLHETQHSTSEAEMQASTLGSLLEGSNHHLKEFTTPEALAEIAHQILIATRSTAESMSKVEVKLADCHKEIDKLRSDLQRVREDTRIDALTGIGNRKAFDEALEICIGEFSERSQGLCLIVADIDNFRQVNEHYGHLFGDKVIKGIAQILKLAVRGRDTVARFGGEEFAILLPDTTLSGAHRVADHIRNSTASCKIRHAVKNEIVSNITASFGVAAYIHGEPMDMFIDRAEAALFDAKTQGRNRVSVDRSAT